MRSSCLVATAALVLGVMTPARGYAQGPSLSSSASESVVVSSSIAPAPDAVSIVEQGASLSTGSGGAGIGVKVGTLGIGVQGAVAVAKRVNVRGGFNVFSYSHTFDQSGASIDGSLKLQSVEANLDLLIGGGFRFSPGVLLYNNNHVDGTLTVNGGQSFSIGGQDYTSLASDPIRGTASLTFNKFSPMLAIGFGQLVPRSGRHFSMAFDLGVVFEDAPTVGLTYGGSGCLVGVPAALGCKPINSQANIVSQISSEQTKFADAVNILKYYPVASLGFGWRF